MTDAKYGAHDQHEQFVPEQFCAANDRKEEDATKNCQECGAAGIGELEWHPLRYLADDDVLTQQGVQGVQNLLDSNWIEEEGSSRKDDCPYERTTTAKVPARRYEQSQAEIEEGAEKK